MGFSFGRMTDFFRLKKAWLVSPLAQIFLIATLYVASVVLGYTEHARTGMVMGYPLSTSLFLAPIYEELVFRGWILGGLLKDFSPRKAVIISSVLFGAWHVKNVFWLDGGHLAYQIAYTTLVVGPVLALVTIGTRTVYPAIILHYLNNLLAPLSMTLVAVVLGTGRGG